MTAPNHALTGAVIGLTVTNPALALPLAFLSHFMCDAIPHYDMPGEDGPKRFKSKRFVYEFLVVGAGLCLAIVLLLAAARPQHWLVAACCAFLAASPDLFWVPRFLYARRTNTEPPLNRFLRFHLWLQWKAGPQLLWLELAWFVGFSMILIKRL
ncbi:MAG TPA: hypothetical protein VLG92_04370 [Candidatus Saccharimonadia bacterium]|nr:hypothetical protein [Candidatus Saccharimonadia bacterium]